MPGKIDVYNLGAIGVQIVDSPVHATDGALIQGQNVMTLPQRGEMALRKRFGMNLLSHIAAAGEIYSLYQIPVVDPDANDSDLTIQWGPYDQEFLARDNSGLSTGSAEGGQLFWGPYDGPAKGFTK